MFGGREALQDYEEPRGMDWQRFVVREDRMQSSRKGFSDTTTSSSYGMTGIVDDWRKDVTGTPNTQSSIPSFVEPQLGNLALFGDDYADVYMHESGRKKFNTRQASRGSYNTGSSGRVETSAASSSNGSAESFKTGSDLRSTPSTTDTAVKALGALSMNAKPLRSVTVGRSKKRILAPSSSSKSAGKKR